MASDRRCQSHHEQGHLCTFDDSFGKSWKESAGGIWRLCNMPMQETVLLALCGGVKVVVVVVVVVGDDGGKAQINKSEERDKTLELVNQ